MGFWAFQRLVWARATKDARHTAIPHSLWGTVRLGAVIVLATLAMMVANQWLHIVDRGLMSADNIKDNFITLAIFVPIALGVLFVGLVIVEGFFIVPFKLWKDAGGGLVRPASPLAIRFDVTNPGAKFWSDEVWPDPHRVADREGTEYRIELVNTGPNTVEDVEVTVSNLGGRSADGTMQFARNRTFKQTMHPGAAEMVKVFLTGANILNEPTSRAVICARGKDVPEARLEFDFDPRAVPIIKPVQ